MLISKPFMFGSVGMEISFSETFTKRLRSENEAKISYEAWNLGKHYQLYKRVNLAELKV